MNGATVTRFLRLATGRLHFLAHTRKLRPFHKKQPFRVVFYFMALTRHLFKVSGGMTFPPASRDPEQPIPPSVIPFLFFCHSLWAFFFAIAFYCHPLPLKGVSRDLPVTPKKESMSSLVFCKKTSRDLPLV